MFIYLHNFDDDTQENVYIKKHSKKLVVQFGYHLLIGVTKLKLFSIKVAGGEVHVLVTKLFICVITW